MRHNHCITCGSIGSGSIVKQRMSHQLKEAQNDDFEYLDKIAFSKSEIENRAKELGVQIKNDMGNIDTLICILHGARFWADLLEKELSPTRRIDTHISFYHSENQTLESDNKIEQVQDFEGQNILIVEDIVSKGRTLSYIIKLLLQKEPKKISVCTLLNITAKRLPEFLWVNQYINYSAFDANLDQFFVGFGIRAIEPLPEHLRYLKDIYILKNTPEGYYKMQTW